MNIGLIFAVLTAFNVAVAAVFIRRGSAHTGESFSATAISIFLGIPFFAVAISIAGEWDIVRAISPRGLLLFAAAGVLHYVVGRTLTYNSIRIIGANKSIPFINTNIFYAVIFGIFFLHEPLTALLIPGVVCIFAGVVLISTEKKSVAVEDNKGRFSAEAKGILAGLGGAICWGISPIIIRMGMEDVGSPYVGALVSYAAAAVVLLLLLVRRQHRDQLSHLSFADALVPLLIAGIFASVGQLFRYLALAFSPASVVTPLICTSAIFIIILSFLLNRRIEVFTPRVIIGIVLAVAGTFLLFQ